MNRVEKAVALHDKGYNCAQAVACAFADVVDVDEGLLYNMTEAFGAGMGNTRGVCGAMSGAAVIIGMLNGNQDIDNPGKTKAHTYKTVGPAQVEFAKRAKGLVCHDIKLGNNGSAFTSCDQCVRIGTQLVEEMLEAQK